MRYDYPHTNFHELNLDWIIEQVKKLGIQFDEFKVINQITFSGAWDITKQYPAWTIVSDNNIGYISIVPVPAGVTLDNGNYWREVIDYTSQIAGVQQRVVDLENDVSLIKNRKFVFIGDSYGVTPSPTDNWIYKTIERLGLTIGVNAFLLAEGGASFGGTDGFPLFENLINSVDIGVVDAKTITDVVICGGYNDIPNVHGSNSTTIKNGIDASIANAKSRFVNCTVSIGFIGYTTDAAVIPETSTPRALYITESVLKGAKYLNNVEYAMHYENYFQPDKIHPYSDGASSIADAVTNAIITGSADVKLPFKNAVFTPKQFVAMTVFNQVLGCQLDNNILSGAMFYAGDEGTFQFGIPEDISNEVYIGDFSDSYIFGDSTGLCSVMMIADVVGNGGSTLNNVPVRLSIKDRKLYAKIFGTMADMTFLTVKGKATLTINSLLA